MGFHSLPAPARHATLTRVRAGGRVSSLPCWSPSAAGLVPPELRIKNRSQGLPVCMHVLSTLDIAARTTNGATSGALVTSASRKCTLERTCVWQVQTLLFLEK